MLKGVATRDRDVGLLQVCKGAGVRSLCVRDPNVGPEISGSTSTLNGTLVTFHLQSNDLYELHALRGTSSQFFDIFSNKFFPSKLTFTCKCVGVWMLNESAASTNRLHTRLETHTEGPRLCNPGQRLLFHQRWRPYFFFFFFFWEI